MSDDLKFNLDAQTRVVVDLPQGREYEMVVSSPTGEIKTLRDTLPTVTFAYTPLSILDIPFVVEKLMAMYTTGLQAVANRKETT